MSSGATSKAPTARNSKFSGILSDVEIFHAFVQFCPPNVATCSPSGKKATPRNPASVANGAAARCPVDRSRAYSSIPFTISSDRSRSGDSATRFIMPLATPSDFPLGTSHRSSAEAGTGAPLATVGRVTA